MDTIQIVGEDLLSKDKVKVPSDLRSPTGGAVAKLAGADDPQDYVVIQWLSNGDIETLRPDETVRPDDSESQRFILFRSALTYPFEIDSRRIEWGAARIRGDVLKKLVGVDPTQFRVWQQNYEGEDQMIANDEFADLKPDGLEVFFTAKRESTEGDYR